MAYCGARRFALYFAGRKRYNVCKSQTRTVLRARKSHMLTRTYLLGFGLLLVLIIGCGGTPPSTVTTAPLAPTMSVQATTPHASNALAPQSNDEAQVSVQVTPITLEAGKPAIVEIAMNTHSVELDADMLQAAVLRDDAGNEHKPQTWDGPGAGGHHRAGKLTFDSLPAGARTVTLVLKNIAQVPERVFSWKLGSQTNAIPQALGELTLVRSTEGLDALREFTSLHNKQFTLVDGYRAEYANGKASATLWVTRANDAASALALTQDMAKKIGAGNTMFQNLQALTINGRQIYVVDGQGQQHYFYANGDRVVWLAVDPTFAPNALHALWNVISKK